MISRVQQNILQGCRDGDLDRVREALSDGADPNFRYTDNQTLLHFACIKVEPEIVDELLVSGADPNMVNKFGYTPLHFAADQSQLNTVKGLLANGADPTIENRFGESPLTAITEGIFDFRQNKLKLQVVKLLEDYFPTLQNLSMRSIRGNRINITEIPPKLYSPNKE